MIYLLLAFAILMEGFGTTMLKLSKGFTKLWPSVGVVLGFGVAFYSLTTVVQFMPLSYAYATWAGAGTALAAFIGFTFFKEKMGSRKIFGIVLIVIGVFVLNFFK